MRYCAYKIFKNKRPVQELFLNFKDDNLPFLLESSLDMMGMGRYSFFASDPFLTFFAKEGHCVIEKQDEREIVKEHPLRLLRQLLKRYQLKGDGVASYPFLCGAVGFFAYDFGFSLEKIKRKNSTDELVPELMFGFYDCVVCVDHKRSEAMVFSSGFPQEGILRRKRAQERLGEVFKKILKEDFRLTRDRQQDSYVRHLETPPFRPGMKAARYSAQEGTPGFSLSGAPFLRQRSLASNFSKERYLAAVEKVKDYIAAGDIYQVNLSQRFKTHLSIDDWVLYERLVKNFPVSFSGFFKARNFSIISASPERFLNFDGRVVSTRPMKGTRRRTGNTEVNQRLKKDLIESTKEKAELLMIVDLERNDLGRVCDYGSIRVRHLRTIETYSNVFQATAEIEGILHRDKDRLDLIKACFPGGSITGCPKIRAMEIIEELEPDARSIYTGSLGYLSFHNTLQFNILIRSFLKKRDEIFFNVGGGIVIDSKPEDEYEETLVKGKALMDALGREFKYQKSYELGLV